MTYEHLKLCPAVVSGEIYLARTIQEGGDEQSTTAHHRRSALCSS